MHSSRLGEEEMLLERETEGDRERGRHNGRRRLGRPDQIRPDVVEDAPFVPINLSSRQPKSKRKENPLDKPDMYVVRPSLSSVFQEESSKTQSFARQVSVSLCRKKTRREGDVLVVDPPCLILKGLPRVKSMDGRWIIPGDSGNPALTTALASFKDQLHNTVKVVYGHCGAFGDGDSGVAIAKFKHYKEADAASRAFEAAGRGRKDWAGVGALPDRGRRRDRTELFGWLAEKLDMDMLPKRGREFKWRMRPLKEVQEKHEERLKEVEVLQARVEENERAANNVENELAEQAKAQKKFNEKIADMYAQTQEAEGECKKVQTERDQLQRAEKEKMARAEKDHEAQMATLNREVHAVREKRIKTDADIKKARKCMFNKRLYEDQMQKRREEVKGLEKLVQEQAVLLAEWEEKRKQQDLSARNQMEELKVKKERFQESHNQLASLENKEKESSKKREASQAAAKRKELLKNIHETSGLTDACVVCFEDEWVHPPPPPTHPDYKELKERCRHLLVPCGHRNMCGGCCDEVFEAAEAKGMPPLCPTCREEIQTAVVLRVKF